MQVPKLKPGQMILGPEYFGCINSGRRPAILRLKRRDTGYEYVVAVDFVIDFYLKKIYLNLYNGFKGWKMYLGNNEAACVYKSRSSAVKKFNKLCEMIERYNQREIAKIEENTDKAKQGDMAALLELGLDQGVQIYARG